MIGRKLRAMCGNKIIIPVGRIGYSPPTESEIQQYVKQTDIATFRKLLEEYKDLDAHLKLKFRILDYQRARKKANAYPIDVLTVTVDVKKHIGVRYYSGSVTR